MPHFTRGQFPHPTRAQILRFSQAVTGSAESERTYRHLVECETCFAEYVRAVGGSSSWLRGEFRAPPFFFRLGPARQLALAALAALACLMPGERDTFYSPAPPLREAVARSSAGGLVLPGAERCGPRSGVVVYRSAEAPGGDAAVQALNDACSASADRPDCADAAAWAIAGLLANDRIDDARVRALEARSRFPRDARFSIFSATVAYRESRLADAEECLREAIALEPRNPVARFDLAVVLAETDRTEAAIRLAAPLDGGRGHSVTSERARTLLASLR
ncbi:MAG: tetratricopeptide repeat protein [bacterium]